jgi:hypothetical protein
MFLKFVAVIATAILVSAAVAQPTATAFTYQGRLTSGSQPASGLHDFQFRLFGDATGGSQIGPVVCVNNVLVTDGLFTATLDFGQQFASSAPRFVEFEVRADTGLDCTNGAGFFVLAPRSQLTTVPVAAHTNSAFALDAPSGSHPNAVSVDNSGRVGVGTTTPQASLHVATPGEGVRIQGSLVGDANVAWMTFFDVSGAQIGYLGDASSQDRSMYLVATEGDVQLTTAAGPALTVETSGRVGIGATNPLAKLDVRGDIRFGQFGQFRAVGGTENLRIVQGVISFDGSWISGSGFTVTHPSQGQYTIAFNIPFSGPPAVTATVMEGTPGSNSAFAMTDPPSPSGVNLKTFQRSDGAFVNRTVHFIAIGPR